MVTDSDEKNRTACSCYQNPNKTIDKGLPTYYTITKTKMGPTYFLLPIIIVQYMEEYISRIVGAIKTQGEYFYFVGKCDIDPEV